MSLRPTYPDARRKRKHFATVIRCSGGSDGKLCGRQTTTCGHETTRTTTGWDLTLRGRGSSLGSLILSLANQRIRHLKAVWLPSASVFSPPHRSEAGGCPAGMQEDIMNQEKLPSWARLAWRGLTLGVSVLSVTLLLAALPAAVQPVAAQDVKRYVAEYSGDPGAAVSAVADAGGTIVAQLSQLNLIVADSDNPDFAAALAANPNITW